MAGQNASLGWGGGWRTCLGCMWSAGLCVNAARTEGGIHMQQVERGVAALGEIRSAHERACAQADEGAQLAEVPVEQGLDGLRVAARGSLGEAPRLARVVHAAEASMIAPVRPSVWRSARRSRAARSRP